MTRNTIGLLEIALEISTAKANGCDGGDCSCGVSLPAGLKLPGVYAQVNLNVAGLDDCLATGWEAFAPQPAQSEQPPQPAQSEQPKKHIP